MILFALLSVAVFFFGLLLFAASDGLTRDAARASRGASPGRPRN